MNKVLNQVMNKKIKEILSYNVDTCMELKIFHNNVTNKV